jgi:hypothetical protein
MEFLQKLFGQQNKLPTGGKSASEFLEYNGELINRVVREIIDPFLKPSTTSGSATETPPETDLSYTLKLIDADTCGQMAFFLSKNMAEQIKTYDISGFGGPINIIAPGSRSISETNIQTPNGIVSRKQICDRLSAHYITIINLIGAILTAINPDTNMALARMNSLYSLVDGTTDKFIINICAPEGKQVVHNSILDEPGLREFLGLYLFHLLSVSESPADKDRVMHEYQNLVRKLVDEDRTVAMPLEIPNSNVEEQVDIAQGNTNTIKSNSLPLISNTHPPGLYNNMRLDGNQQLNVPETGSGAGKNDITLPNQSDKPGIFKVLTDKISSGLNAILPEQKPQTLAAAAARGNPIYTSNTNSVSRTSNQAKPKTSYGSSSSQYTYSDSEREQKKQEINNLAAEINAKRAAGKQGNDPEIINLTNKIQNLITELDNESSSSSNISGYSSYKKWLAYKKHKYGTNSSNKTENSSSSSIYTTESTNQYGGKANLLSDDASITRFINFMEKYIHENPTDKRTIMRNVLTLFKGGHFKKPDTARIKTLCSNAKSESNPITLQIDPNNQYLRAFNDNYLEMRHSYMKSVGELVAILENHILIQNPKTQKMDLRNLSSRELGDLETRTRIILAQLYSTAHTHYVQGVNSLYDYYHNLTSGVNIY